jgi:hypothetical protein
VSDFQGFEVEAISPYGGITDLSLRCIRCRTWAVHIGRPVSLADLLQRANKHAEECARKGAA